MNNLFEFSLCYQAGSNGSVQDFNEQKRNEQQKLEEIKVHIKHLKFIPTCAYEYHNIFIKMVVLFIIQ